MFYFFIYDFDVLHFWEIIFLWLKGSLGTFKICFNDYFIADYFNGDGLMWFALFFLCFINCCRNYKLF